MCALVGAPPEHGPHHYNLSDVYTLRQPSNDALLNISLSPAPSLSRGKEARAYAG